MLVDIDAGPYVMIVVAVFCAAIVATANACTAGLFCTEMAVIFGFNVGIPAVVAVIQIMVFPAADTSYAQLDYSLWPPFVAAGVYAAAHVSIFGGCHRYYGYLALPALSFVLMTLSSVFSILACLRARLTPTSTVPLPPPPPAAPRRARSPRRRVAK